MFAKVFSQIFDSSIAQDYTVRHMFMDLLALADSTGAVDMTPDAISRRTNVPFEIVTRCLTSLAEPDEESRSKAQGGRRIILLDSGRVWGWQIVNYAHYRKLRDEEARRAYFRDSQRVRRARKRRVKDKMVTLVTNGELARNVSSASSSKSACTCTQKGVEDFCESLGLPRSDGEAMFLHWQEKGPAKTKDWKATIRKWKSFGYLPSQKGKNATNSKPNIKGSSRTYGTANEKRIGQYDGVGKLRSVPDIQRSATGGHEVTS